MQRFSSSDLQESALIFDWRGQKGKNRVNFFRKKKFLRLKGFLFLFLAYSSILQIYFCPQEKGRNSSFVLLVYSNFTILILPSLSFESYGKKFDFEDCGAGASHNGYYGVLR